VATATDDTTIATTAFVHNAVDEASGAVVSVAGKTGAVTLDASDVGLAGFAGLTPATLPLSTATTGALAGKENGIAVGTISQYWRGDKTFQPTVDLPVSTATQTALDAKVSLTALAAGSGAGLVGYQIGGGQVRTVSAILGQVARIEDYYLSADGADYYPAYGRAITAGKKTILFDEGTYPFLTAPTLTSNISLIGKGSGVTVLQAALSLAKGIIIGTSGVPAIGVALQGLTLSRASGTIPASSIGIAWDEFNYGSEVDVRVTRHARGRRFTSVSGSTSIGYTSNNCYADTCSEVYEEFAGVAGCYLYSCRYGRNGGETVDVSIACTLFTGGANDIVHVACPYLPNGPNGTRPNCWAFNDIVGATGLMLFNQCLTENTTYVCTSNSTTTAITALNVLGGRYAHVGSDFFSLHANTVVQYSNLCPENQSTAMTLTKPYRVRIGGQHLSLILVGGTSATCKVEAMVLGNMTMSGAWTLLTVDAQVGGTATNTSTGIQKISVNGLQEQLGVNAAGTPMFTVQPPVGSATNRLTLANTSDASPLLFTVTSSGNAGVQYNMGGDGGFIIGPRATTNAGGLLTLNGQGANGSVSIDNSSGNLRLLPGSGKLTQIFENVSLPSGLGNYANDAAAAAGGIAINQLYRNGSVVMIRVS
jgi:hypothetical protein